MDFIQTEAQLDTVLARLVGATRIAADTEAAGYHRYFDRVCLLQLSSDGDTFVIDTLAVGTLDRLRPIFADPAVEVVFHDADYDLRLLHRDFGITVEGLFDTKTAAQFLGEPAVGLASLLAKHLDITVAKAYQRADWAQRPLPSEMLDYAAEDTRYLLALRDRLGSELEERGRLAWAEEEFRLTETIRWTPGPAPAEGYLRLKGTRDLRPRQLAGLREIFAWREELARSRDVAPFRVLSNEAMIEIARRMPEGPGGLAGVPGAPRTLAERHGSELLAALARARDLPQDALPVRPRGPGRPPPDPEFDALVDRLRAARDSAAATLGLDRGFLMPRAQLEEIAKARPRSLDALATVVGIRRWQVEALGEALVATVRG